MIDYVAISSIRDQISRLQARRALMQKNAPKEHNWFRDNTAEIMRLQGELYRLQYPDDDTTNEARQQAQAGHQAGRQFSEDSMKNPSVKVTLPYPPSVNRLYNRTRSGGVHKSARAVAFTEEVALICNGLDSEPFTGRVRVDISAYRPSKRGDIDNIAKATLDALEGYTYHNDKQIVELHIRRFDDPKNPRLAVKVTALDMRS